MKIQSLKNFLLICLFSIFCSCTHNNSNSITIGVLDGPTAVSAIQLIDQPTAIGEKRIQVIVKTDPQQIQALMMQGKLDFAILPTVMAANLYNKGVRYRMLACPVWGTLYVMTNTQATRLYELKNHTISIFGQSSTADVLMRRLIDKNRIPHVTFDYSRSNNNEIAQALRMRQIAFGVVSEPLVSKLLAQDTTMRIVSKLTCEEFMQNSDKNIFVQTAFLVNSKFIEENPDLLNPVCDAYSSSCNFTNNNPDKTAELMVKHKFAPNTQVALQSIPLCNIQYVGSFALQQEINSYLKIFYKFNPKSIGGKMPDQKFIFTPMPARED